jgi:hypothetical protein
VGQNLLANVLKACLAFHADVGCVGGLGTGLLFRGVGSAVAKYFSACGPLFSLNIVHRQCPFPPIHTLVNQPTGTCKA